MDADFLQIGYQIPNLLLVNVVNVCDPLHDCIRVTQSLIQLQQFVLGHLWIHDGEKNGKKDDRQEGK